MSYTMLWFNKRQVFLISDAIAQAHKQCVLHSTLLRVLLAYCAREQWHPHIYHASQQLLHHILITPPSLRPVLPGSWWAAGVIYKTMPHIRHSWWGHFVFIRQTQEAVSPSNTPKHRQSTRIYCEMTEINLCVYVSHLKLPLGSKQTFFAHTGDCLWGFHENQACW